MIGSAIRKYAKANGLKCDGGFAYGALHGCQVALDEGSGFKRLWIYLYPSDLSPELAAECDERAAEAIQDCDAKALHLTRKDAFMVGGGFARLTFVDNWGSMKQVQRYMDEVLPKIAALHLGGTCCAWCGEELEGDVQYVRFNGFVLPVHSGCSRAVVNKGLEMETEPQRESVLAGGLGALLGAVVGAIPWAVMFMLGYMSSLVGFVIGALANWLYGLFHGKRGFVRIPVVLLALIIGVALGQVGGYSLEFNKSYSTAYDMSRSEYILACWDTYLIQDQETMLVQEYERLLAELPADTDMSTVMSQEQFVQTYRNAALDEQQKEMRGEFVKNAGMGLAFGLLGCAGLFVQMNKESNDRKARELV